MADNKFQLRRSRTQSLPPQTDPFAVINRPHNPLQCTTSSSDIEEENFEADDETSRTSTRRPSTVAKKEIAQARRLSKQRSSANSSPILMINSNVYEEPPANRNAMRSSSTSLFGQIYSLGGAVWNFIRGPTETDSNDELSNYHRNKSKSFSISAISSSKNKKSPSIDLFEDGGEEKDVDVDIFTDSSDAPNFNENTVTNSSPNNHKSRIIIEEGRDKVVFNEVSECVCNLIGRDFTEDEHILESRDISTLQSQIPARWKVYFDWILLYSSRGNGFSLTTLYHQLKPFKGPILIAIKDEFGTIFGAFLNQSLQPRQGHYGNGECFLWRKSKEAGLFTKYPSTGKNNYFIITEPDYLAVGCGGGKFGLWLEKDLFKGISDPVPTFDNEQLSTNQKFECIAIEIWGLNQD